MDRRKYNLRHLWYIVSYILSRISNELACNAGVFWRASAFDQASAILNSHSEDRGLWRDEKASKGKKNNGGGMEEKLRLSVIIQFEIIWQKGADKSVFQLYFGSPADNRSVESIY